MVSDKIRAKRVGWNGLKGCVGLAVSGSFGCVFDGGAVKTLRSG